MAVAVVEFKIRKKAMPKKQNSHDGENPDTAKIPVRMRHPRDLVSQTDLAEAPCLSCRKTVTIYKNDDRWYCPHCNNRILAFENNLPPDFDPVSDVPMPPDLES